MSKIRNRFKNVEVLTCHDNLLANLFDLDSSGIYYQKIDGEDYLINSIITNHYEIGLRVKVDNLPEDIPQDTLLVDNPYVDGYIGNFIVTEYLSFLTFTNIEKYMVNVLLDKYLYSNRAFDMSFLEIEHHYRGKGSYRSISLSKAVSKRYAKTLDSLCKKELYLKTDGKFREVKYGVNNLELYQPFLVIQNACNSGGNNITFSYSFRGFGRVLKLSRRYSNILPIGFYRVSFNQVKLHLAAWYLAQQIFIQKGLLNKDGSNWTFEVDINTLIELTIEKELKCKKMTNYLRLKRQMAEYVMTILSVIPTVIDYKVEYSYDETERFVQRHEFDYDIENDLDNYEFTSKDLDQDVDVKITAILRKDEYEDYYNKKERLM